MPSPAHQTLLLWAARKMASDGYRVAGYEGASDQGGAWNDLTSPPILAGVRPDAWGFDGERIAFAEAKSADDIDTRHTRLQFIAFARLRARVTGAPCRLYIAVPRSAAAVLDRVLAESGLAGAADIVRLHIPDILLKEAA